MTIAAIQLPLPVGERIEERGLASRELSLRSYPLTLTSPRRGEGEVGE
jgi:hypothetical protein